MLWRQLSHKNVLPLLGVIVTGDPESETLSLLSPWAESGTVTRYLKRSIRKGEDPDRLGIVADVLAYMHSHDPPMVHADIHPGNILIDEKPETFVTDFGFSRFSGSFTTTGNNRAKGIPAYWAPELWKETGRWKPSVEADVYAFGCLCFEIYTLKAPWSGLSNYYIEKRVAAGERPERPLEAIPDAVWDIIESCWQDDPKDRMSMKNAWIRLKALHDTSRGRLEQ
ncbi:kinase-like protein [Neolentinus lepideus HHB14362 ss-1]|uniref:Kinase-like protein n=1 Tax=Neolentinus lepideus HHB14362 ss-1 TaxID=1314782 RepID=A0A165V3P0_9AGAM|nr:kinase-like protein [Neolentinus lepideus HHB14362 ss-1]